MGWPQTYDVRPLDFGDHALTCRRQNDGLTSCLVVGVAVLIVYTIILQPRHQYLPMPPNPFPTAAGMVSNVVQAVSARVGELTTPKCVLDGGDVYKAMPKGLVALIDSEEAPGDSDAWKRMSDAQKTRAASAARAWLDDPKHARSIIMIFAPWCGHCHNAMPKLASAASEGSFPVLMINAEAMPVEALTGEKALLNLPVEYFPLIVAKSPLGTTSVSSPDAAIEHLKAETADESSTAVNDVAPDAAVAAARYAPLDVSSNEGEGDGAPQSPFADLF